MRKRERENPCGICGHYHKYEEGEVCGVCGHRPPAASPVGARQQDSAFPSEILKEFLFLGSYDNASRSELLKTIGVSHILNTVPLCQNLYRNSFTYHCLQEDKTLQFDDANQFLEQCEREKARVLVHCMSGKSRSAAFVIAFLMKSRGWRLAQSFQWVKERRPQVQLSDVLDNANGVTTPRTGMYSADGAGGDASLKLLITVTITKPFSPKQRQLKCIPFARCLQYYCVVKIKEFHPCVCMDPENADLRMMRVMEAYQVKEFHPDVCKDPEITDLRMSE
ncbi:Protein-tyrosine-phosphatase IBR5 [Zea mays]|uniref:Protein-tyrosine-phosphatase IBR5 n=1 Tax=Zea mays TaxID=4577 RepID=A0A3L6EEG7_MAIZE|nr:Protein-tyrosine-phosphatase IBR5 [Zea mays]